MGDLAADSMLQAKLALAVDRICKDLEKETHETNGRNVKFSRPAVVCLSKFMLDFTEVTAKDLSHFQKHAKRSTINNDDVMLCARKNDSVSKALHDLEEVICPKLAEKRCQNDKKRQPKKRGKGKENHNIDANGDGDEEDCVEKQQRKIAKVSSTFLGSSSSSEEDSE